MEKLKLEGEINLMRPLIAGVVAFLSMILVIRVIDRTNLKSKLNGSIWLVTLIKAIIGGLLTFIILYFILQY